jgi:NTE family protein
MSITINQETKRIGMALSGGGFRAAGFHLGAFRKLDQLGLLWQLDLLTCVSGGSIAGAFLAAHWGERDALDRLEHYLRNTSIAVSSVLSGILDPLETRLDKLAGTYDRDLFAGRTLEALKSGPRLYLNATNLASGNMFFFVAGGNLPTEMGDWEMGTVDASSVSISRAVAASSAFPPVFPPLRLDAGEYPTRDADFVCLTDGGVYDNLGVNPLMRKRNALDYVLVSDGGRPFAIDATPTELGSVVLIHAIDILMEQVRGLQFKRLELNGSKPGGAKPAWFSIDSQEGQARDGDAAHASSIGTNLKRLAAAEIDVLTRHGGALLEHRLRTYMPELLHS